MAGLPQHCYEVCLFFIDVENVAARRPALQSGLLKLGDNAYDTAYKAVDGDRNTCTYADTRYGYTTYGAPAWLQVDLGEFAEYDVVEVIIHTPAAIADRSKLINVKNPGYCKVRWTIRDALHTRSPVKFTHTHV